MKQQSNRAIIGTEAGLSLLLMAGVPVFVKFTSANPFTIGFFRLTIASLLLFAFFRPDTLSILKERRIAYPLLLIGGIFAMHWITYFLSIKLGTATIGFLGVSTYGIHLILVGWIARGTKPGIADVAALLLALLGTYLIVPDFSFKDDVFVAVLLAIFSGFCFAMLPVLHQRYQYIPERMRMLGQFSGAWLVFACFYPLISWELQSVDWWAMLYLAIPGTFIAHTLWIRVTTKISTVHSSLIFYMIMPITMTVSHFWLDEPMPITKVGGAFLVISGNLLSLLSRLRIKARE